MVHSLLAYYYFRRKMLFQNVQASPRFLPSFQVMIRTVSTRALCENLLRERKEKTNHTKYRCILLIINCGPLHFPNTFSNTLFSLESSELQAANYHLTPTQNTPQDLSFHQDFLVSYTLQVCEIPHLPDPPPDAAINAH